MNEVDLIPEDFHQQRQLQRLLRGFLLALAAVSLLLLAPAGWLAWQNNRIENRINDLQQRNRIGVEQRQLLASLRQQQQDLEQQLQLLQGLRSGAAASNMFLLMDRSLPERGLWLTQWQFRRAGTRIEAEKPPLGQGYFIVIPKDGRSRDPKPQTWRIDSEMTLGGQAVDYDALSRFVLRLTEQPEVSRVRMLDSQRVDSGRERLVHFRIGVTLKDDGREAG